MLNTKAYAARTAASALEPFQIDRRAPGPFDVLIDIMHCGICHTDIHAARGHFPNSIFPLVPGHEIIGAVSQAGDSVTKHRPGDVVGVGCMVDSCGACTECRSGEEQFCLLGMTATYNARERNGQTPTYGGYSARITVNENFVLRVPGALSPAAAAPLLCAGITTYSPLRHWEVEPGMRVGVIGLGGLGHMAVKLAAAMGAEVTVFSTSEHKRSDAARLGAENFSLTSAGDAFSRLAGRFDLIINTASATVDYDAYVRLLKRDGSLVILGVPDGPVTINAIGLIMTRTRIAGSLIGGIRETQEMLDFCAEHRIVSDIEPIPIEEINVAYERMLKGDVRYRFVIDMSSLRG